MRLIDANALKLTFCKECTLYPDNCLEKNGGECDWGSIYHIKYCAPTIDAVPVIRCADCKYLNEDLAVGEWDGSCRYWNTHSVLYSWFCSQGERKDGDENG